MENFLNALRYSIATENWYAAIMVALTLPDICGSIDTPGKNNTQERYRKWFTEYVGKKKYRVINPNGEEVVSMTGGDCFALRCAVLHQGVSDTTDQSARDLVTDRFVLHHSNAIYLHNIHNEGKLIIDIPTFCKDIIEGVSEWETNVKSDTDPRRKTAISNLMKLHLPDIRVGNMTFAHIKDPFK